MKYSKNPFETKAGKPMKGKEEQWLKFRASWRTDNNPYLSARGGALKGKESAFFQYLDDSRLLYLEDLKRIPKEVADRVRKNQRAIFNRMSSEGQHI